MIAYVLVLALAASSAQSAGATAAAVEVPAHAPVRGDADAPIPVVLFSDLGSDRASRAAIVLRRLVELRPERVRVVFRHLGAQTDAAVHLAARAAHAQGRFWEYHDLLVANVNRRDVRDLIGMAVQLGLDEGSMTAALQAREGQPAVAKDMEAAKGLKLPPTGAAVFVNGQPVADVTLRNLLQLADAAR